MKITNAYIERTFNLGNYESLKVGFDAVLSETDRPLDVTQDLEMLCHQHFENRNKPTPPKPEPTKTPAQLANEATARREAATKTDPTKCPKCGANKKPQFQLCYNCHEEEKAN